MSNEMDVIRSRSSSREAIGARSGSFRFGLRVCTMMCFTRCWEPLQLKPVFALDGPPLLQRAFVRRKIRRLCGSRPGCGKSCRLDPQ